MDPVSGRSRSPAWVVGRPAGAMNTGARDADLSLLSAVQCGALTRKASLRLFATTSHWWPRSGGASTTQVTCRADHWSGGGQRFHERNRSATSVAIHWFGYHRSLRRHRPSFPFLATHMDDCTYLELEDK